MSRRCLPDSYKLRTNNKSRNNPLRGDDRPKYVTTPECGPETTKTRQRAQSVASPLPEKRPRDLLGDEMDSENDRKKPRLEDTKTRVDPQVQKEDVTFAKQESDDLDLEEGEVDD
jgi:hypothetical protein